MIEILPIRILTDTDNLLFGTLNVSLGKLHRAGLPIAPGIVVTAPYLKLKVALEHYDFGTKEVFLQSLTLVKQEISKIPIPQILLKETAGHKNFLLDGHKIKSVKELWQSLLRVWIEQIKNRLWDSGFYTGITEGLEPKAVMFIKKVQGQGTAYFDTFLEDVQIQLKTGKPRVDDFRKIREITKEANKKLFMPYEYEWIIDRGIKLVGLKPYMVSHAVTVERKPEFVREEMKEDKKTGKSAVKVFFDLSAGFIVEKNIDGIYLASEKIFDLNKPHESFDQLVFKLVESAVTFPDLPILFKLADKSEGMGKIRGTLRLLHQNSLLEPMLQALDFARHKKGLNNVHVVIPFVRGVNELLQIKRELAVKKLMRKNSLEMWLEVAVLENIINLENYLITGIDGVVLNLDELIAHLNGFDPLEGELALYKNEVEGLLKFLEDGIRLLHRSKIPFIAYGSLSFYPKVLEFLVEKGVYGIVVECYDVHSAYDLLRQTEKRMIFRRS